MPSWHPNITSSAEAAEPADGVAVVGAGVVGCAIAWALTRAGWRVLLIDRAEPASAGASFGNAGHIATEQVQPLPSWQLLLGFWRELVACGGVLDLPLRRALPMGPWLARFAKAALRQREHTKHLAPLVRTAADTLASQLRQVGRPELLRRNGHYVIWFGPKSASRAAAERAHARALEIDTRDAPPDLLRAAAAQASPAEPAGGQTADAPPLAGVWFPNTAHVLDPAQVARAFASAAMQAGTSFLRTSVQRMAPAGKYIEIATGTGALRVRSAVVCAGAWSAPLLASFGVRAPLEAERGYHVELPGRAPLIDAPLVYGDHRVIVTPLAARLRASSYLEFAGLEAPADARKPARLRAKLQQLGYRCAADGPSWMGPRPTLPDYLPGIGRASGEHALFYAVGHQHIGLTLAAVTAELIARIVAGGTPRFDLRPFDLARFGRL